MVQMVVLALFHVYFIAYMGLSISLLHFLEVHFVHIGVWARLDLGRCIQVLHLRYQ